ncbi:hypothetical protein Verru16b_00199 [Lacunisphaera limnophila]|uniref:Uncharacterized protein n=1 Tax=Lacunisphaera limnophila TaxID=1838286 RepID=A0A1I7PHR6_9BACT|nr:hypothetical protein [Lacunisphaera limnophila]AOS43158.1 hypothetical protein Verru16b_00199 [Lacunisphaera limnophila]
MRRRLSEFLRGPWRRRAGAALLVAAAPKCLLCAAAYAGLGTAAGLGGPELCGPPATPLTPWIALLGLAGATGLLIRHRSRPPDPPASESDNIC